jgi:hypothetical protein
MAGDWKDITPSLGPVDITFTVGGQEFEVAQLPAVGWLDIMAQAQCPHEFLLLCSDGRSSATKLDTMIVNEKVTKEEVREAYENVLCRISGRPWWEAIGIVSVAVSSWDAVVGGKLALHRVDASRITFACWLDAVWLIIREAAGDTPEARRMIEEVRRGPASTGDGGEPEMDVQEFDEAMAQLM